MQQLCLCVLFDPGCHTDISKITNLSPHDHHEVIDDSSQIKLARISALMISLQQDPIFPSHTLLIYRLC